MIAHLPTTAADDEFDAYRLMLARAKERGDIIDYEVRREGNTIYSSVRYNPPIPWPPPPGWR